ncbi:MAG: hypothetical protein WCI91_03555 [Candidatus Nomurabacteria bacterium]
MKKIRKVDTIDVKRCFAVAELIKQTKGNKYYLSILSKEDFNKRLLNVKSKVIKMTEKELDKIVSYNYKYKKRLISYSNSDWYMGEFDIKEAGVWRRAGGLPLNFTNNNLFETAKNVKFSIENNLNKLEKRSKIVIPNILNINVDYIQKEKYLLPITFIGGTGTKGRRRLKVKTQLDIDDGCMRSISLAVSGKKIIRSYIGFHKDNLK